MTQQTIYVDPAAGNDLASGSAPSEARKTLVPKSNTTVVILGTTPVVLKEPLDFSGLTNAVVQGADPTHPITLIGEFIVKSWATTINCTLANVTLTSASGRGTGGNIRGLKWSFLNVNMGHLGDALVYVGVNGLTIRGGQQVGPIEGRCHYLYAVQNIDWDGGTFGPSGGESPIRTSYPGVKGGTIKNVKVTQAGVPNKKAAWAIHAASDLHIDSCTADQAEFSFNSAGQGGATDKVTNCVVSNLTVNQSKLTLDANIAFDCTITNPTITNDTGEGISLVCAPASGNSIVGGTVTTKGKHAVEFYNANDTKVSGVTLHYTTAPAPVLDGAHVPANDAGGNVACV